jgi:hypothetical protein
MATASRGSRAGQRTTMHAVFSPGSADGRDPSPGGEGAGTRTTIKYPASGSSPTDILWHAPEFNISWEWRSGA